MARLKAKPAELVRLFLAKLHPPDEHFSGGTVEPIDEPAEDACLTLEIQDIEQAVAEGIAEYGLPASEEELGHYGADPNKGIVRYYMNVRDARVLCCQLIHALACGGDRVALRLEEVIRPAISDLAAEDGEPDPFPEDN